MNKAALVDEVAKRTESSKMQVSATVDAVFEVIRNALVAGERVIIAGFGSFRVRDRTARTINNPRTGEPMQIPAKKVVSFKPGKFLRLS